MPRWPSWTKQSQQTQLKSVEAALKSNKPSLFHGFPADFPRAFPSQGFPQLSCAFPWVSCKFPSYARVSCAFSNNQMAQRLQIEPGAPYRWAHPPVLRAKRTPAPSTPLSKSRLLARPQVRARLYGNQPTDQHTGPTDQPAKTNQPANQPAKTNQPTNQLGVFLGT